MTCKKSGKEFVTMYRKFYTTAMCPQRRQLERRFRSIASARPVRRITAFASAVLVFIITAAGVFASGAVSGYANRQNKVEIFREGSNITALMENKPFWENNSPYLPLRETWNMLGIQNQDVIIWGYDAGYNANYVDMLFDRLDPYMGEQLWCRVYIDNAACIIDGVEHILNAPPILRDGVTYVPYDFFMLVADAERTGIESSASCINDLTVYCYDRNGDPIDISPPMGDIESGMLFLSAENTLRAFFDEWANGRSSYYTMQRYCTGEALSYFHEDDVYGFRYAVLHKIAPLSEEEQLRLDDNEYGFSVTFTAEPTENSVYSGLGASEFTYYAVMRSDSQGYWKLERFATGL